MARELLPHWGRVSSNQERHMYEAPKLVKYGTFREMTQQTKNTIGGDITPGWTGGLDCEDGVSCRS